MLSSEENATCETRGMGIDRSGWKFLTPFSTGPSLTKLSLMRGVVPSVRVSGPAAANSSCLDAMLRREEVGLGRLFEGHGGTTRSFASPAIAWKPTCCPSS